MAAIWKKNKFKRITVGNLIERGKIIPVKKCRKELKIYNQYHRKRKNQHQSFGINTRQKIIFKFYYFQQNCHISPKYFYQFTISRASVNIPQISSFISLRSSNSGHSIYESLNSFCLFAEHDWNIIFDFVK